ncbi:kinase-like domain-containing protein [Sordaria brevicollis]|uniref:Kinase-like domain-containing protein n=1 Tax=Sordaria brevicollis TaxID=83679 RepID=A0AAE0P3K0_SORBR|nr:kinase-like domain-containing protein [Sordaria brevicollis]
MARKAKAIGLADPGVDICHDRGNSYYDADNPVGKRSTKITAQDSGPRIFDIIREELEAKAVEKGDKHYIPRRYLREILTPGRLLSAIQQLWKNLSEEDQQGLCTSVLYVVRCWKVFLMFIYAELEGLLPRLWEAERGKENDLKLSDQCLPLVQVHPQGSITCQKGAHSHKIPGCKASNFSRKERNYLKEVSYAINAVYFKLPKSPHSLKTHVHYCLGPNDVLPYRTIPCTSPSESRLSSGRAPTGGKTDDTRDKRDPNHNDNPNGGFGVICKVVIEQSHFNFGQLGSIHIKHEPYFAVKRLYASDEDAFDKELASLTSVKADDGVHLIKLLTTFSVEEADGSKTFYLVFPWAEGTLWDYWERRNLKGKLDRLSRTPWMARQCYELARALMCVHNERTQHLLQYPDLPSGKQELYGRHGDIKAENVLYFEGNNSLVLSDFGLGRLYTKYSRSAADPKTLEKSATYRAPEFDLTNVFISRASDIFSLGCMYLEFLTWYLMGYEAVSDQFPEYRTEMDNIWGFESDTFFTIENDKPILKRSVQQWMEELKHHKDATAYTDQFLEIIKKMLAPVSDERMKISDVVKELEKVSIACQGVSSFYEKDKPLGM